MQNEMISDVYEELHGHVFIGMVSCGRQPRDVLVKMVGDLDDGNAGQYLKYEPPFTVVFAAAGIRFVFFSRRDANTSKGSLRKF